MTRKRHWKKVKFTTMESGIRGRNYHINGNGSYEIDGNRNGQRNEGSVS